MTTSIKVKLFKSDGQLTKNEKRYLTATGIIMPNIKSKGQF